MYAMTQGRRNGRGQAVALGLVRAVLRGANMLSAMRHNEAMRARLSEEFGGYLVTEENPCDMTAAEMAACWPFGGSEPFSDSRWMYEAVRPGIYRTGWGPRGWELQAWAEFEAQGNCLDAAWWIAAGSVSVRDGIAEGMASAVMRGEA